MKILHVISSMNPRAGGVCKAVRDIIYGMDMIESGVTNEVVCLDKANENIIGNEKLIIHSLGNSKTAWAYSNKLYPWLKSNYKNYDLVIVHGLWQYQSYVVYKLSKKFNIKYFVMPHGMLDPYFQKAKGRKIKALRNEMIWSLIEGKLIKDAQGLLFTCEEEKQLAKTTFKDYFPKKELTVGLGVETPPTYTESMQIAFKEKIHQWNGKPYLLFLGRIDQKKGVELLIEAYLKLEAEISEIHQLIIAGPDLDTAYGKDLINLAQKSNNILFPGMLSGASKWGAFYCSAAFILPSHQENFGIAVVEALACAKPVLISNQVNIWREIIDGEGGLVSNDNSEDVYCMLRKFVLMNITEKEKMGHNAQKVYETKFMIQEAAKKMLNALTS